jgi:hypothetical protein
MKLINTRRESGNFALQFGRHGQGKVRSRGNFPRILEHEAVMWKTERDFVEN